MNKKIKIARYILPGLILLFLLMAYSGFSYLFNCFVIDFSGFQTNDSKVYFSPSIGKSLQDSLLELVLEAKARNQSFWGTEPSDYKIIFCATDKEIKKYAGNEKHKTATLSNPFTSFIILGKPGYDINIIAHELSHTVLISKIGYRKKVRTIPTWFDEGIALQVDERKKIMDSVLEKNYKTDMNILNQISKPEGFYLKEWDRSLKNYLVARYELKLWLRNVNKENLNVFLKSIAKGVDFISEYEKLKKCTSLK